jgi:multidrug efflux pump subunit AcrA (membrane-fusion protein)
MLPLLDRGLARRNEVHMLRQTHLRQEIELARLRSEIETARGTGTVIEPGATIAEIVPQQGPVHASAEMPAEMVGAIRPGQAARVKVLTFDHTRFGALEATVTQVSASSFRRQDGSSFYRVTLALPQDHVGDARLGLRLNAGMTVVADIRTGERSLLAWLLKPVRNALDTAFGER